MGLLPRSPRDFTIESLIVLFWRPTSLLARGWYALVTRCSTPANRCNPVDTLPCSRIRALDLDLDATMATTDDVLKQKRSHTLSSMVFKGTWLGPLRKIVHWDHSSTISSIGFWNVRNVNADLYHDVTWQWNWVTFGNLVPLDGVNLLTAVTSRNKLLEILCYPFPKEIFLSILALVRWIPTSPPMEESVSRSPDPMWTF